MYHYRRSSPDRWHSIRTYVNCYYDRCPSPDMSPNTVGKHPQITPPHIHEPVDFPPIRKWISRDINFSCATVVRRSVGCLSTIQALRSALFSFSKYVRRHSVKLHHPVSHVLRYSVIVVSSISRPRTAHSAKTRAM